MSALGGICYWQDQPLDPHLLAQMGQQMQWMGPDRHGLVADRQAGVVQQVLVTSPLTTIEGPIRCTETGCIAASDARIDNRKELVAALDLRHVPLPSDTEIILATYLRWGEKATEKLIGDFTFSIWDPRHRHFFCARDRMGVRPLYYLHQHNQFACASHPGALLLLPGITPRRNEQRLACYLLQILPDDTATAYVDLHRLPPGYSLKANAKGVILTQYWSPLQVQTIKSCDDQEYAATFRTLFTEAVRCRLPSVSSVGSTLSGGLDSSSITCLASSLISQESGNRLHTFSATFPSLPPAMLARIDERQYMEEVLQSCHPLAHEIQADTLQPFATLADDLRCAGQPFFGPNLYIHNGMYESAAEQGVKIFLDGTDGDSVVSYGFERLPHLLLTGRWQALINEIAGLKEVSNSRQSMLRLIGSYAIKPSVFGLVDWAGLSGILPENRPPELLSMLQPDFRKRVDMHELLLHHRLRMRLPIVDASAHHRAALALPFLSHVLESNTLIATRYSIETRYPFLDHRLVEFCLSLPAEQKLSNGWSRAIQRKAMAGMVPDSILRRITKADLSPNYYYGLAVHGPRLLEETIRPAKSRLAEYFAMDLLLPRLEACLVSPEKNKAMAIFFSIASCLTMWLLSSEKKALESLK